MQRFILILALMAPAFADAGLIAPDGNEWELRGTRTDVAGHTLEAVLDTGWIWATTSQWHASGLNDLLLSGLIDVNAFEGACDGSGFDCNAFLNTDSVQGLQDLVICVFCAEQFGPLPSDRWNQSVESGFNDFYRVSFIHPPQTVAEPISAALLGLGLLGLGLARRRVKQ